MPLQDLDQCSFLKEEAMDLGLKGKKAIVTGGSKGNETVIVGNIDGRYKPC